MATKYAEKLIILKEAGDALMQRLYSTKQQMSSTADRPLVFQQPGGNIPDLKRLFRELDKNFPEFADKRIESVEFIWFDDDVDDDGLLWVTLHKLTHDECVFPLSLCMRIYKLQ